MSIEDPKRRYFSSHYIIFRILGLGWWHHPDENDTRNFPGHYVYYSIITELIWVVGFIGLESLDPFIGEVDLDRLMFSIAFVVTHDLTIVKIYIIFFKNKVIQEIVHILDIDLHQFHQNDVKNLKSVKVSRILTASLLFFGWLTIGNCDAYGILQDMKWKSEVKKLNSSTPKPGRIMPQPIYIPWNYESDSAYIFSCLFQTAGLLWTGHILIVIDTFIGALILHMSTQFSNLREAFTTAYNRTIKDLIEKVNKNREEEDIKINDEDTDYESIVETYYTKTEIESALEQTLIRCFRQHQLLISCVDKFTVTYSYGFMTQLLSSVTVICVVMVQISNDASSLKSMRLVTTIAFFAAMLIQLSIQCISGEELTHQAGLVSDAVMSCKWELMSPRLRRLLLMPMIRAQRPLRLTAGGFAFMNNACFVSIIKAAYSYYAVLSDTQG